MSNNNLDIAAIQAQIVLMHVALIKKCLESSKTGEVMGKNTYRCSCRCNQCRRIPGSRRVECHCCGHLVGPGCCLSVETATMTLCHVCNADSYRSRCEGLYMHWQLGQMWDALVCYLILSSLSELNEPEPEP